MTLRSLLVNAVFVLLGATLAWALLANPFGLSSLDSLRHRLLGDRPVVHEEPHGGATVWTCPMHPEIQESEPGSCPICKMDLVPAEDEEGPAGALMWTCPMHPEIQESEPGSCPICKMDLVPEESAPSESAPATEAQRDETASQLWTCGMHPEIIQDEPGTCPICHMDLVPLRREPTEPSGHEARAAGPSVTIDPGVVQNMNVQTRVVERGDLTREIRTVGYLEYDQQKMVTVTTKYPGWVEGVYVNYMGEPVRKGQPLFDIYSPELVQTERDLLSALEFAKRMEGATEDARSRAEDLVAAARQRLAYWDISAEQVERLEATGEVLRALTVTAPASGVVMKRMPGLEGMAVRPGMELFHIADLSSLWLSVEAFEEQLGWLQVGSVAEVSLSYFPGETFRGRVRFISPQVNEETRTVPLQLEVPNRRGRLRAGMYATVRFDPKVARDAVLVPTLAVLRTGQRNLVIVAEGDGRFSPREVQLGSEGEGRVEVLSGVEEGETIVTSAQFLIDSESNLREAIQKLIAARGKTAPPAGAHLR
jgi:Cu(I)/Ag(I) efflux system membrane fusion protein/cobalt-zinc-cadmium efflux system membrane fusion protein